MTMTTQPDTPLSLRLRRLAAHWATLGFEASVLTEAANALERSVRLADINPFLREVIKERARAKELHPDYNSYHEAHGVMAEELEEFWEVVRMKTAARETPAQKLKTRTELIQLAVTAWRASESLGLEPF